MSFNNEIRVECSICERHAHDVAELFCAGCARNAAYPLRLDHARVLLEKETLHDKVANVINVAGDAERMEDNDGKIWSAEILQLHLNEAKKRTEMTKVEVEQNRQDIDNLKSEVGRLKAQVNQRRNALTQAVQSPPPKHQDKERSGKITSSMIQLQSTASTNRALLCREAASLMRLRQRRRQPGVDGRDQYSIAGLTLPDLREISNVRCTDLSAVLSSVAHLTLLAAFYLGIRLPAEIIPPSSEHPLPMINTPNTSYRGEKGGSISTDAASSHHSSPSTSRHDLKVSPKSRPLFMACDNRDERVYTYQQHHTQAFNLFVEGIALLAWNIGWLCRSQGFTAGTDQWEGICNLGRNLHQLIVANAQAPSMARLQDEMVGATKRTNASHRGRRKDTSGKLGQYSDLSAANTSLRTPQNELLMDWAYLSWQAIATSLRKTLLTEIASAEWELLQDDEWDESADFDAAVMVKSKRLDSQHEDSRMVLTKLPSDPDATRIPGTSGWTKLKSREG